MSTIERTAINILTLHALSLFSSARPLAAILNNYTPCKKCGLKSIEIALVRNVKSEVVSFSAADPHQGRS